ncbi:unnamed protein product [Amoebophrya sp. A120]|nr:unnamed protein product [Amoebophrya sp. A120]|eukprot:GSA120T00001702001.1
MGMLSREIVIRKLKEHEKFRKKEQTTLAQLHDVFEEGEGLEFLGDPMWWRYPEDIDTDRIYITTGVEFRQIRLMAREVIFHFLLLGFVSAYILNTRSSDAFLAREEQLKFWQGCNSTTPETAREFREGIYEKCDVETVVDIKTFWTWLDMKFVPLAFTPQPEYEKGFAERITSFDSNSFKIGLNPRLIGDPHRPANLLLGLIRMRQVRVQKNQGCTVSSLFSHIFSDCRALFKEAHQSTSDFSSSEAPTYTLKNYQWKTDESTGATAIAGQFSEYPASGFLVDFPLYETEAHMLVHDLWNFGWLDSGTRAVVLEFSFLNTNVNIIVNNRMLFEFAPTGNVILRQEVDAWPVWQLEFMLAGDQALNAFIYTALLAILLIYQVWNISWHMRQCGLKFFGYGWNYVDIASVVLWIIHFSFRITAYTNISSEVNLSPSRIGHPEYFMPFSRAVVDPLQKARTCLSFLSLTVWFKTLKYACIFTGFRTLVRVMGKSLGNLFNFSLVVLVIFFAFAVSFYVGFGGNDQRFTDMFGTFLILFFYLVGGFELNLYDWFLPGSDIIRPLIFLLYLLLTYFILVNVFMAIVLDSYTMVVVIRKAQSTLPRKVGYQDGESKNFMITFLYVYYHFLRGIDLVGEEEKKEEDAEFEFIDLEELPGVVAKKWLMKKRRMMETVARVNGEEMPPQKGFDDDDNEEGEDYFDEHGNYVPKDQAPQAEHPSLSGNFNKGMGRIKEKIMSALMPDSQKALNGIRTIPKTTRPGLSTKGMYVDNPDAMGGAIGLPQLQRLLDEDKALRILLGSADALAVIKRFKYIPNEDDNLRAMKAMESGAGNGELAGLDGDDLGEWEDTENETINQLQEVVFSRLDKLEKSSLDVDITEVPQIKFLATQLSDLLSDVQNCWREGIISVLESANLISGSLLQFTKNVEDVSQNHNNIMEKLCVDEDGSDEEEEMEED